MDRSHLRRSSTNVRPAPVAAASPTRRNGIRTSDEDDDLPLATDSEESEFVGFYSPPSSTNEMDDRSPDFLSDELNSSTEEDPNSSRALARANNPTLPAVAPSQNEVGGPNGNMNVQPSASSPVRRANSTNTLPNEMKRSESSSQKRRSSMNEKNFDTFHRQINEILKLQALTRKNRSYMDALSVKPTSSGSVVMCPDGLNNTNRTQEVARPSPKSKIVDVSVLRPPDDQPADAEIIENKPKISSNSTEANEESQEEEPSGSSSLLSQSKENLSEIDSHPSECFLENDFLLVDEIVTVSDCDSPVPSTSSNNNLEEISLKPKTLANETPLSKALSLDEIPPVNNGNEKANDLPLLEPPSPVETSTDSPEKPNDLDKTQSLAERKRNKVEITNQIVLPNLSTLGNFFPFTATSSSTTSSNNPKPNVNNISLDLNSKNDSSSSCQKPNSQRVEPPSLDKNSLVNSCNEISWECPSLNGEVKSLVNSPSHQPSVGHFTNGQKLNNSLYEASGSSPSYESSASVSSTNSFATSFYNGYSIVEVDHNYPAKPLTRVMAPNRRRSCYVNKTDEEFLKKSIEEHNKPLVKTQKSLRSNQSEPDSMKKKSDLSKDSSKMNKNSTGKNSGKIVNGKDGSIESAKAQINYTLSDDEPLCPSTGSSSSKKANENSSKSKESFIDNDDIPCSSKQAAAAAAAAAAATNAATTSAATSAAANKDNSSQENVQYRRKKTIRLWPERKMQRRRSTYSNKSWDLDKAFDLMYKDQLENDRKASSTEQINGNANHFDEELSNLQENCLQLSQNVSKATLDNTLSHNSSSSIMKDTTFDNSQEACNKTQSLFSCSADQIDSFAMSQAIDISAIESSTLNSSTLGSSSVLETSVGDTSTDIDSSAPRNVNSPTSSLSGKTHRKHEFCSYLGLTGMSTAALIAAEREKFELKRRSLRVRVQQRLKEQQERIKKENDSLSKSLKQKSSADSSENDSAANTKENRKAFVRQNRRSLDFPPSVSFDPFTTDYNDNVDNNKKKPVSSRLSKRSYSLYCEPSDLKKELDRELKMPKLTYTPNKDPAVKILCHISSEKKKTNEEEPNAKEKQIPTKSDSSLASALASSSSSSSSSSQYPKRNDSLPSLTHNKENSFTKPSILRNSRNSLGYMANSKYSMDDMDIKRAETPITDIRDYLHHKFQKYLEESRRSKPSICIIQSIASKTLNDQNKTKTDESPIASKSLIEAKSLNSLIDDVSTKKSKVEENKENEREKEKEKEKQKEKEKEKQKEKEKEKEKQREKEKEKEKERQMQNAKEKEKERQRQNYTLRAKEKVAEQAKGKENGEVLSESKRNQKSKRLKAKMSISFITRSSQRILRKRIPKKAPIPVKKPKRRRGRKRNKETSRDLANEIVRDMRSQNSDTNSQQFKRVGRKPNSSKKKLPIHITSDSLSEELTSNEANESVNVNEDAEADADADAEAGPSVNTTNSVEEADNVEKTQPAQIEIEIESIEIGSESEAEAEAEDEDEDDEDNESAAEPEDEVETVESEAEADLESDSECESEAPSIVPIPCGELEGLASVDEILNEVLSEAESEARRANKDVKPDNVTLETVEDLICKKSDPLEIDPCEEAYNAYINSPIEKSLQVGIMDFESFFRAVTEVPFERRRSMSECSVDSLEDENPADLLGDAALVDENDEVDENAGEETENDQQNSQQNDQAIDPINDEQNVAQHILIDQQYLQPVVIRQIPILQADPDNYEQNLQPNVVQNVQQISNEVNVETSLQVNKEKQNDDDMDIDYDIPSSSQNLANYPPVIQDFLRKEAEKEAEKEAAKATTDINNMPPAVKTTNCISVQCDRAPGARLLTNPRRFLENPLYPRHGEVVYMFYEVECLIVVQEKLITFWKFSHLANMLAPYARNSKKQKSDRWENKNTLWFLIGRIHRRNYDTEVTNNCFNRICVKGLLPMYLELRCNEYPKGFRQCNLTALYVNVYYFGEDNKTVKMHSVDLDAVQSVPGKLLFTTMLSSRTIIVCWSGADSHQRPKSGLVKYLISRDCDTLINIKRYKYINYEIKWIELISNDRVLGYGETALTMWAIKSGDVLLNYNLQINMGIPLGSTTFEDSRIHNVMLLYQYNPQPDKDGFCDLFIVALDTTVGEPDYRILCRHKIPQAFLTNMKRKINTGTHIVVTTSNNEDIWLSKADSSNIIYVNPRPTKRFYMRNNTLLAELSENHLGLVTMSDYLVRAATNDRLYKACIKSDPPFNIINNVPDVFSKKQALKTQQQQARKAAAANAARPKQPQPQPQAQAQAQAAPSQAKKVNDNNKNANANANAVASTSANANANANAKNVKNAKNAKKTPVQKKQTTQKKPTKKATTAPKKKAQQQPQQKKKVAGAGARNSRKKP